jgi:VWFA-related protein
MKSGLRYRRSVCFSGIAALLFATALPAGLAQVVQSSRSSEATFEVNARLVVLDVVVTDVHGKPVDTLTQKDFQVYEDGQLQTIRSLEPPSVHSLPASSIAAGAAQRFDPAAPEAFGVSPVNVLLLDEANTHFADSSFARRQIHDYLARQPALLPQPTTLLSIYDGHFRQLQGFTRDRDALLRALASAPTEYAWKLEINGSTEDGPIERLDQSLRALNTIAQDYARIPGRKNLIWVGGGFPTLDPASIDGADAEEVKNALEHTTDVLLETRITLYAVDPASLAAGLTEITDSSQLAFATAAGDSMAAGSDPFNASQDFDKLGPVTGGRIVRGRNDVSERIADSISLGDEFYTLSYTPSSTSQAAASYRKIRVVCMRPGLTATTRTGYYAGPRAAETSSNSAAYDLTTAAESSLPLNAISVTAEPDKAPNAAPASYIVRVRAADLTWKPKGDGSAIASVYIEAAALDPNGKLAGHTLRGMIASAKPGTDLRDTARLAEFLITAPTHPQPATLRFIVRDSASGRMGATNLTVQRP